jgi:hypothetical protein
VEVRLAAVAGGGGDQPAEHRSVGQADNAAIDRSEDGVQCRSGLPDIRLSIPDLPGGFSQALMFSGKQGYTRGPQVVSLGLAGVGGTDPLNVYQINLDGAVGPGEPTRDNNPAT